MNAEKYNAFMPENISEIIGRKGLKQCAVAEKAGLGQKAFSDMLHGRRIIKVIDILNIAGALGVTPNDIFGIKNDCKAS